MRQPQGVMSHSVLSPRWAIGASLTENVPHPGAGDDQKPTATHPDLSMQQIGDDVKYYILMTY